jgi:arylsulfatase A-like enzyme
VLPTCAELAGVKVSASIDGVSFLPTLLDRPRDQKQHDYFYWELAADRGFQEIRMGDWKAEILNVSQSGTPKLELYNLKEDPAEKNNVSGTRRDLAGNFEQIAATAHTPNSMFPLTYEECQKAAPRGTVRAKAKARDPLHSKEN